LESVNAADLGLDLIPRNTVTRVEEPPARKSGVTVDSVDSLLQKLKNEAGVL
jgi:electron transfer flavoprotein beta subunit